MIFSTFFLIFWRRRRSDFVFVVAVVFAVVGEIPPHHRRRHHLAVFMDRPAVDKEIGTCIARSLEDDLLSLSFGDLGDPFP